MENGGCRLGSKWKRTTRLIGIVGSVYLSIRYLLPLFVPFLAAGVLAKSIYPAVRFLHKHTRLPQTAGAVLILVLSGGVLVVAGYFLGGKLVVQAEHFAARVPDYLEQVRNLICCGCSSIETALQLRSGCMMEQLITIGENSWRRMQESAGSYVTAHLIPMASWCVQAGAFLLIVVLAAVYWIKERETIARYQRLSMYRQEIALVLGHCTRVGGAYLRVELLIMCITAALCVLGLALLGNEYALLAGLSIGLLDALPFLGTGTVFFPWILIDLVQKRFLHGAGLAVLYLVCYLVREIMESRLLGERIGITALETMISMYVGWQLFGLWGLFLGPVAWILIKEIDKYENEG